MKENNKLRGMKIGQKTHKNCEYCAVFFLFDKTET